MYASRCLSEAPFGSGVTLTAARASSATPLLHTMLVFLQVDMFASPPGAFRPADPRLPPATQIGIDISLCVRAFPAPVELVLPNGYEVGARLTTGGRDQTDRMTVTHARHPCVLPSVHFDPQLRSHDVRGSARRPGQAHPGSSGGGCHPSHTPLATSSLPTELSYG